MIKVILTDGSIIDVPGGKVGVWDRKTVRTVEEQPTEVNAVLNIKDADTYGSAILASFQAKEVKGYTYEAEANKAAEAEEE